LHVYDIVKALIASKRAKQNEFPKAVVGNCKPHTIFTATKKPPRADNQFFHPGNIFFVGRTPFFPLFASTQ